MPTLIDSLIVRLSLDPTSLTEEQKKAGEEFIKRHDETLKAAEGMEKEVSSRINDAFRRVQRDVLAFFGVLLGAREVRDFVASTVEAERRLFLFGESVGVQPAKIAAFAAAVEGAGGSADAAMDSVRTFWGIIQGANVEGRPIPATLARLGGVTGFAGRNPDAFELMTFAAGRLSGPLGAGLSESEKRYYLNSWGITDPIEQDLVMHPAKLAEAMREASKTSATDEQIRSGQRLAARWTQTSHGVRAVGRSIVEHVAEPVAQLLETLNKLVEKLNLWVDENKGWLTSKVQDFVDKIDWTAIGKWLAQVGDTANKIATAMGGWTEVAKIAAGFFVAGKLSPFVGAALTIAGVFNPMVAATWALIAALTAVFALYEKITTGSWTGGYEPKWLQDGVAGPGGASRGPGSISILGEASPSRMGSVGSHGALSIMTSGGEVSEGRPMPVEVVNIPDDQTLLGLILARAGGIGGSFFHMLSQAAGNVAANLGQLGSVVLDAGGRIGQWWVDHTEWMQHAKERLMKELGLSEYGAEGWLATWAANEAPGGPTSVGPGGDAGINQAVGPRKPPGYHEMTAEQQLDYIIKVDALQAAQRRALEEGRRATTPDEGAQSGYHYERPASPYPHGTPVTGLHKYLHDHPAAHDHAAEKQSMRPVNRSMDVATLTVHAKGANARGIAREIRLALQDELSLRLT